MLVFISYAHEDGIFKNEMLDIMNPLTELGIEIWHDELLAPGSEWEKDIKEKIDEADVSIVLVSKGYLKSEYCKNIEIRQLFQRRREHSLQILPILVTYCFWEHHKWLPRIEMRPKIAGTLVPLYKLKEDERDQVYREIAEHLHKLNHEMASGIAEKSREFNLNTAWGRKRFAEKLVHKYEQSPDTVMHELAKEYLSLYGQHREGYSKDLVIKFSQFLQQLKIETEDEIHKDILILFESGLPKDPLHLRDIAGIGEQSLFEPGFAVIVHALFQVEQENHQIAINSLMQQHDYSTLSICPFRRYILGQCFRKRKFFGEAKSEYVEAAKYINKSEWTCAGICKCNKNALSVEIHRGLGVVYRNLFNYIEAEYEFSLAEKAFTDDLSTVVKADVCFSYGYLLYECAFKSYHSEEFDGYEIIDDQEYKNRLWTAKSKFEKSCQFRDEWDAPIFRLAIVRQLLGQDPIDDYLRARRYGIENGIEGRLSAVICGIAALLLDRQPEVQYAFKSETLFDELTNIFVENYVSPGARECHAFDVYVIVHSRQIKDKGLERAYNLLWESARWDYETLDEQRNLMIQFVKKTKD